MRYKEYVARKNVSFRLDDAMKLAEEKFNIVTKGRMELEAQQCPSVRTELLATGAYC
jgi:hypothetical protein